MTALEVLTLARSRGIRIRPNGDRLRIEAPAGALTADLKRQLAQYKAQLIEALAPADYITLRGGLVVPAEALCLAWNLEDRGIHLRTNEHGQLVIPHSASLTDIDHAAITRWHLHLAALLEYECPEVS